MMKKISEHWFFYLAVLLCLINLADTILFHHEVTWLTVASCALTGLAVILHVIVRRQSDD